MGARREEMPGLSKMDLKKKTRQEHGTLKWVGLRICVLARKKKKLNHDPLSFEVAKPQIHSGLLFS